MTASVRKRILAIDIHALYAGYAVLEGPKRLVDWGMLHFKKHGVAAASVAAYDAPRLIARCRPDRIVITMPANQALARERLSEVKRTFLDAAARARIPVCEIPREKYLKALDARTRYAAAEQATVRFPALAPRLPKRRKIWQAERPIMAVFDATAAGVAYFLPHRRRARPPAA